MGGEEVFFLFFKCFGYQKMESMKHKPKKEITFIFITMGLVVIRTILSVMGLKSGNVDAMKFSLILNLIPVLQTMLVLLRKISELERKREKGFNGIYRTTNATKEANPFLRRLFVFLVYLSTTIVAPILYLCRYSTDVGVESFSLELIILLYMILATVDGIFEQVIILFSVDV